MLYCYHIPPVDFWTGAVSKEELVEATPFAPIHEDEAANHRNRTEQELDRLEQKAHDAFREIGWEGDVREGPYFFSVPGDTSMVHGYILKQDNNGSCFIASPVPLPHLGELSIVPPIRR